MKTYTITHCYHMYLHTSHTGTLAELVEKFSYTLLCGHQRNPKIPTKPKSIKSLVKALQDSARETTSGRSEFYWLES